MSHLPGLSDFLGLKKKQPATVSSESNGSRVGLRDKTESKGDLAHISDEDQIKNLFSGMSRSLIKSTARVARNKKIVKRNIQANTGVDISNEDISAQTQSMTWTREVTRDNTDQKDDSGWETDLELEDVIEGFDHSGKTAYVKACYKNKVVPVSYYLRHMHESELKLRHHQLGCYAIKPIAISLVSNAKILSLDLTDNALGVEGAEVLCQMLRENCFITHLNLSENQLTTGSAEMISDILQITTSLTHVVLSDNHFDDKAAVFFAEAIMNTTKIEYLNLSHNQFAESGGMVLGPAIAENSSIKELDLSWNSLRRRGATAVAQGVKNNIMIKKLNLSWNGFGVEGCKELGKALMENTTLEELHIINNRVTTEAAVLLGKGIASNETLQILRIGKNPMQSAGCWAICSAVLKNPNASILELDFEDVLVNKDFHTIKHEVLDIIPNCKFNHGGLEPPKKPKARVHPMTKLQSYITKNNLKLIDFFQKFDTDGSMSVSHAEFKEGLEDLGIALTEDELEDLIAELDKDGDGEINYSELVIGNQEFTENSKKEEARVVRAFNPNHSDSILRAGDL